MPTSILNINTKFRNNYANTKSTDFIYNLPFQMKNVSSMKYVSAEFANEPYSLNSNYGSNNFKIIDKGDSDVVHNVVIQEGNNSGNDLAKQIKTEISELGLTNHNNVAGNNKAIIDVSFNNHTRKFNFTREVGSDVNVDDINFDLDFTYNKVLTTLESNSYTTGFKTINEQHLSLGWIMGFRKKVYTFADDYKLTDDTTYGKYKIGLSSESEYDKNGSRYYMLMINDYNNHKNMVISSYQQDTLVDNNIMAKFKYDVDSGDDNSVDTKCCLEVKREYTGNVNINRLQIRLIDEYGRIVDLNEMDFSFALEVETDE